MGYRRFFAFFCLILVMLGTSQASGKQEGPLASNLEAYAVTEDESGREVLEKTEQADPGQIIEYRMTYHNNSPQTITGLNIIGPVPANTAYVAGSAATPVAHEFFVSIDGGMTWETEPVKRLRSGPDGSEKEVVISADEYTGVKWIPSRGIAPAEEQVYQYRVKVD